jgi:hypothetical protein
MRTAIVFTAVSVAHNECARLSSATDVKCTSAVAHASQCITRSATVAEYNHITTLNIAACFVELLGKKCDGAEISAHPPTKG